MIKRLIALGTACGLTGRLGPVDDVLCEGPPDYVRLGFGAGFGSAEKTPILVA